jgi:tRNA/tmRNA/rRNA uracil-C5-methylase (TrmA/RlmC/RlmD family)
MPINDILEFTPTTLAYGGDAFGRVSSPSTGAGSRAIFVPFALPGETVRVRILEEKRRTG